MADNILDFSQDLPTAAEESNFRAKEPLTIKIPGDKTITFPNPWGPEAGIFDYLALKDFIYSVAVINESASYDEKGRPLPIKVKKEKQDRIVMEVLHQYPFADIVAVMTGWLSDDDAEKLTQWNPNEETFFSILEAAVSYYADAASATGGAGK